MIYNLIMEFSEWITRKYILWRGDTIGREGSVSEYAAYLGVAQQLVSEWMQKGGSRPAKQTSIAKLADKYGVEVFDVLGIELSEEEREMWEFRLILKALTPEERAELKRQGYRMLNKSGPPGHTGQPQKTREGAAPPEVFNKKQ